jgi:hypothetical protein
MLMLFCLKFSDYHIILVLFHYHTYQPSNELQNVTIYQKFYVIGIRQLNNLSLFLFYTYLRCFL